jgi:hydroxyacylglutathione hydrolase
VGNCRNGGDPELLYATCRTLLARLPASTKIYPGHDYLMNNLRFTQNVEPGNATAGAWLERCKALAPETMPVMTLTDELTVNSFFRLGEPGLREGLRQRVPELAAGASEREVFLRLRELRNDW